LAVSPQSPLRDLIAYFIYSIGLVAVITGRAKLFTENTQSASEHC